MTSYASQFAIGDKVFADGCDDLTMTVTAITFRSTHDLVECSWISGQSYAAWIEPFRLTKKDDAP